LCYGSLWGCAWFAIVPFIPPGSYQLVALVNIMSGCAIGAAPVLGASMAADVIDFDALRVRQDRSALFFSLWAMGAKAAQALGIGLILPGHFATERFAIEELADRLAKQWPDFRLRPCLPQVRRP